MRKWIAAVLLFAMLVLPCATAGAAFYELGDPVADFTLTTVDGEVITLNGLLAEHRAVLINFWFIDCPWCDYEFPFLQEAWEEWKDDIAVVAVTPYDSDEAVREYRDAKGFTFPMAGDSAGLSTAFGVTGYPISVVIDRYGVVVFSEAGAQSSADSFRAVFSVYGAEDYKQSLVGYNVFAPKPSETMAPPENFAAALNEPGTHVAYEMLTDSEWPWLIRIDSGRNYAVSSNAFIDESTAWLRGTVSAKAGEVLAFEYHVSSEYLDDYFVFSVDGKATKVFSGERDWTSYAYRFPEDGEYHISFAYEKGFSGRSGEDMACLDAVRLLSGAEAEAALAANPAWPASLEGAVCTLEAAGANAREVVVSDPSGRLDRDFHMDSFYIMPDGDTSLRALLGDGCDPDAVLLYNAAAQEILHPSECDTDETGFLFTASLIDMDGLGHLYGAARAYPFYGDYENGVASTMFFDSEESLERFLRLALVGSDGQPLQGVSWAYADELLDIESDYGLYFVDESGEPVADVAVQITSAAGVIALTSDAQGSIRFTAAPRVYRVEVLSVPEDLYYDDSTALSLPPEGGEIMVTLTFAE